MPGMMGIGRVTSFTDELAHRLIDLARDCAGTNERDGMIEGIADDAVKGRCPVKSS